MLVNAADMLKKAEAGKYALGAFNTNNLEWTLAILQAAEEAKSPLILQCTAGAAKWMGGFKVCADMVKAAVEATGVTVPVALHLDHGSYEDCFKCIEAGFTSIMYDGSHEETFQLNLDRTKELVELAHSKGMSIEAEVGGIGGTEDGVTSNGELADPAECKQIADLGVDFLACGIGNIHGVYPADWAGLSFERLGEIKAQTGDLPLVLHGGTGIPEDQIKKAISLGISKINVNTDLQLVFAKGVREYIEAGKDQQGKGFDPRKLLKPGRDNIVARTKELMEEFGSVNKASASRNFPPAAPSPYPVSFALTWLRQKSRQGNSSGGRGFLRLTPQGYESELRWLLASLEVARRNQLRGNGASFVNSLQGYWAEFILSRYRLSVLRVPLLGLSFLSRYNGLQEF